MSSPRGDRQLAAAEALGRRIADAISAACHPEGAGRPSVRVMSDVGVLAMSGALPLDGGIRARAAPVPVTDVDALGVRLFED